MKEKCSKCQGTGKIKVLDKCPTCGGFGIKTFQLTGGQTQLVKGTLKAKDGDACKTCEGTGKIRIETNCTCENGWRYTCEICRTPTDSNNFLCRKCFQDPIIYELRYPYDKSVLENHAVLGEVTAIQGPIALISVADIQGSLKLFQLPKGVFLKVGDMIPVSWLNSTPEERAKHEFAFARVNNYTIQTIRSKNIPMSPSFSKIINNEVNEGFIIRANTEILSIRQTSGPTLFKLVDELGNIITGVGFVEAGQRAFSNVQEKMVVEIAGHYNIHQGQAQIDLKEMIPLTDEFATKFREKAIQKLQEKSKPLEIPFSINSPSLDSIRQQFLKVAERIRRAVFTGQNFHVRYQHPSVDGAIASMIIEYAIQDLIKSQSGDQRSVIRKYPQRSSFYDYGDASRDIIGLLEEQSRTNNPRDVPLFIFINLGSSDDNNISYDLLTTYNAEMIVVDNHLVSKSVKERIEYLLNPYIDKNDQDYTISVGMVAFELGRLICADQNEFTNHIKHLATISGLAERVRSVNNPESELGQYIKLLGESYPINKLQEMVLIVDYQLYYLKSYSDGDLLLADILGIGNRPEVSNSFVPKLAQEVQKITETTIKAAMLNAEQSTLATSSSGKEIKVTKVDFDYTARFGYPSPSKTVEIIHDQLINEDSSKLLITLGIGYDYVIIRPYNIILNIHSMVENITKEKPQAGVVEGGGQERVSLIRFFSGFKKEVLEMLMTEFAVLV